MFQTQFPSNHPCEDRSDFRQLINYPGYAAAIYDGHGGWQVVRNYLFSHNFVAKSYLNTWTKAYQKINKLLKIRNN